MERYLNKEKKRKAEMSPGSGNTKEIPHRTQVYVGDAVSIDIDGLSEERYRDEQTYNHKFLEEEDDIVLRQHRKSRKSDRKHSDRKHPKRRRERNDKERVQSTGFMNEDEPLSRRYRRKRKSKSRALESDMDPLEIVERKGKKLKKKSKRKPKVRLAERDTIIGV
ncbi:hypothetical protein BWQ96_02045 [Gracilariopsis chorda]|uniref:Uncharacterized protein n=1 Tax=Gracilariopsis chorda TaxID=448386 RepID=A0A2V3J1A7_9FLOR|nr:hypothetical protein BWQ96_02045 [Gracilariopsis chorda]|eukprot:PXF48093.1 hypothetical protein BWQ96_02045 [Gracilariopsis chorda]